MRDLVLTFVRIRNHRAELVDPERLVVGPHPHLAEEDRSRRVAFDQEADDSEERK